MIHTTTGSHAHSRRGPQRAPHNGQLATLRDASEIETGNDFMAAGLSGWTKPELEVETLRSVLARVVGHEAHALAPLTEVGTPPAGRLSIGTPRGIRAPRL
ncbi:hypothetical protein GCM10009593_16510 [Microlunatus antarcticus]